MTTSLHAPRRLGRSDISTTRLALAAMYGIGGEGLDRAWERGVRTVYLNGADSDGFMAAVRRHAARAREELVVLLGVETRDPGELAETVEALARDLGHVDGLLLGYWNEPPPAEIRRVARDLRATSRTRATMISGHDRRQLARYASDPELGAIMVRYNAVHRGAERDVFPAVPTSDPTRAGVISFTATCWGKLLDPQRVPAGERAPRGRDCYRFVLSRPEVDVALFGPANDEELEEALAALEEGPMSPDERAWMMRVGDAIYHTTEST